MKMNGCLKKLALVLVLGLGTVPVLAASKAAPSPTPAAATFYSVTGKVTVKTKKGNTRTVKRGSTAKEGDTVNVSKTGQATLQFFDGSEMDLKAHSKLVLSKLQRPTALQKNIKFDLKFGELLARVRKLLTPNSSFEVEAGGSVCGVRGTQFDYAFDPDKNKLNLHVIEGTVYFTMGGVTNFYHAGDKLEFHNGHADHPPGGGTGGGHNTVSGGLGGGSLGSTGGSQGGSGLGNNPGGSGGALGDLNDQFLGGVSLNNGNTLGQNGVQGTKKYNITVNVTGN